MLDMLRMRVLNFAGGAGKGTLAHTPKNRLPDLVVNRPNMSFSSPMAT